MFQIYILLLMMTDDNPYKSTDNKTTLANRKPYTTVAKMTILINGLLILHIAWLYFGAWLHLHPNIQWYGLYISKGMLLWIGAAFVVNILCFAGKKRFKPLAIKGFFLWQYLSYYGGIFLDRRCLLELLKSLPGSYGVTNSRQTDIQTKLRSSRFETGLGTAFFCFHGS